jgi:hypothetical protein
LVSRYAEFSVCDIHSRNRSHLPVVRPDADVIDAILGSRKVDLNWNGFPRIRSSFPMAVQSSMHIQRTYDIRASRDRGSKQQTQDNLCVVHHDSRKFPQMRAFSKAEWAVDVLLIENIGPLLDAKAQ